MSQLEDLELDVVKLIDNNAVHWKKGTVMGSETWDDVIQHLREEVTELDFEVGSRIDRNVPDVLAELGDILGILVHATLKAGFTMEQVAERERQKLVERFRIPTLAERFHANRGTP